MENKDLPDIPVRCRMKINDSVLKNKVKNKLWLNMKVWWLGYSSEVTDFSQIINKSLKSDQSCIYLR